MDIAESVSDHRLDDEWSRVLDWRERRLVKLGYPVSSASVLACSRIDLHEIENLLERGCPLDLAIRIAA